jgi:acetyl-CoA carboxylase biotin carboxylase subunit
MPTPIRKVLVANRGEIAVRVIRGCQEMGIATVAVFSEADKYALHTKLADEAVCIGAPPASQSYLNKETIVDAVRKSGADAVHPGYGFLAENAEFSQAVADAGLVFIGPRPENIRAMGDKIEARRLALKAGVPVVPGYQVEPGDAAPLLSYAELIDELSLAAKDIGFPVLIKATAGGGGKGIRIVHDSGRFLDAAMSAMREAESAFGNPTVYIEKYLPSPRHIEVQVLGDGCGNAVDVGERECSVQRRHQKIIEETPSAVIDDDTRTRITQAAVELARAIDYLGAGTVEFLYAGGGRFYFLEMNTRLQVEHPITEMVYGVDLVREQIRIAEGRGLPFAARPERRGHAIECRIYAEDADAGFLPAVGKIELLDTPGGNGIRDDSSLFEGMTVSEYYDPLLSKLVVWADTRENAIRKMDWALSRYRVLGVTTNVEFLRRVLAHPKFCDGDYDTHFLERYADDLKPKPFAPSDAMIAAAALIAESRAAAPIAVDGDGGAHRGPWANAGAWRQIASGV